MIWEPFVLALVLGIIISAGLYVAYLWPSVEPGDPESGTGAAIAAEPRPAPLAPAGPADPAPDGASSAP